MLAGSGQRWVTEPGRAWQPHAWPGRGLAGEASHWDQTSTPQQPGRQEEAKQRGACLKHVVRKVLWVRRGEADAHLGVHPRDRVQQLGKARGAVAARLVHAAQAGWRGRGRGFVFCCCWWWCLGGRRGRERQSDPGWASLHRQGSGGTTNRGGDTCTAAAGPAKLSLHPLVFILTKLPSPAEAAGVHPRKRILLCHGSAVDIAAASHNRCSVPPAAEVGIAVHVLPQQGDLLHTLL